jgi:hypothetical protein
VDPAVSAPFALAGRVVTMDAARTVIDSGVVYGQNGSVHAVLPAEQGWPEGFPQVEVTPHEGHYLSGAD